MKCDVLLCASLNFFLLFFTSCRLKLCATLYMSGNSLNLKLKLCSRIYLTKSVPMHCNVKCGITSCSTKLTKQNLEFQIFVVSNGTTYTALHISSYCIESGLL